MFGLMPSNCYITIMQLLIKKKQTRLMVLLLYMVNKTPELYWKKKKTGTIATSCTTPDKERERKNDSGWKMKF